MARQTRDDSNETALNIALIGPDELRRKMVASALSKHTDVRLQEFDAFPSNFEELSQTLKKSFEIVVIDADSDPDYVFELAARLCKDSRIYVMAYSAKANMKVAVHMMRAGVREFLTLPLDLAELSAALTRASAFQAAPLGKSLDGKLFVFLGAKGGCGVTTLAANFALALAQESDRKALLVDLGLPLGDAAINLGIITEYSVSMALQESGRLDSNLLSTLVVKHESGLSVLAAPGDFNHEVQPAQKAIDRLVAVACQSFDYVVVDLGSRLDLMATALFASSATVYLITQVGISELRNANRMIAKFFFTRDQNLQIVLNRYKPGSLLFDDNKVAEVLTRPAQWKIPDDYAAARRTRETATPMVQIDSAISRAIREMAQNAAGLLAEKAEKRGFFRFLH